jgi:hypothetical protein
LAEIHSDWTSTRESVASAQCHASIGPTGSLIASVPPAGWLAYVLRPVGRAGPAGVA